MKTNLESPIETLPVDAPEFSLVLGGALFQLSRRTRLTGKLRSGYIAKPYCLCLSRGSRCCCCPLCRVTPSAGRPLKSRFSTTSRRT